MENLRETWYSKMEEQYVKSQTWGQWKRVQTSNGIDWSKELSEFSNICQLHSFHTIHIKQVDTRFQTYELCFPNQFLHPNNKCATDPGMT